MIKMQYIVGAFYLMARLVRASTHQMLEWFPETGLILQYITR